MAVKKGNIGDSTPEKVVSLFCDYETIKFGAVNEVVKLRLAELTYTGGFSHFCRFGDKGNYYQCLTPTELRESGEVSDECPFCKAVVNGSPSVKESTLRGGLRCWQYKTRTDGTPTKVFDMELKLWIVNPTKINKLKQLNQEWGKTEGKTLKQFDLKLTCTNSQYQNCTIEVSPEDLVKKAASDERDGRNNKEIIASRLDEFKAVEDEDFIANVAGIPINAEKMKSLLKQSGEEVKELFTKQETSSADLGGLLENSKTSKIDELDLSNLLD